MRGRLWGETPPICPAAGAGGAPGAGGGPARDDAFVLRRCQIVLASAGGERVPAIARAGAHDAACTP